MFLILIGRTGWHLLLWSMLVIKWTIDLDAIVTMAAVSKNIPYEVMPASWHMLYFSFLNIVTKRQAPPTHHNQASETANQTELTSLLPIDFTSLLPEEDRVNTDGISKPCGKTLRDTSTGLSTSVCVRERRRSRLAQSCTWYYAEPVCVSLFTIRFAFWQLYMAVGGAWS